MKCVCFLYFLLEDFFTCTANNSHCRWGILSSGADEKEHQTKYDFRNQSLPYIEILQNKNVDIKTYNTIDASGLRWYRAWSLYYTQYFHAKIGRNKYEVLLVTWISYVHYYWPKKSLNLKMQYSQYATVTLNVSLFDLERKIVCSVRNIFNNKRLTAYSVRLTVIKIKWKTIIKLT